MLRKMFASGVNCDGVMLIKNDDKFVLNEFRYQDIESILLDPSDSFITITLQRSVGENNHKCYVFETKQKNEIGSLIASYYPALAGWMTESEAPQKRVKSEPLIYYLIFQIFVNFFLEYLRYVFSMYKSTVYQYVI